jgi:hypothetical protein
MASFTPIVEGDSSKACDFATCVRTIRDSLVANQTPVRAWHCSICPHRLFLHQSFATKHSRFDPSAHSDSSATSSSSEDSSLGSFPTILASMYNLAAVQKESLVSVNSPKRPQESHMAHLPLSLCIALQSQKSRALNCGTSFHLIKVEQPSNCGSTQSSSDHLYFERWS